MDAFDEAKETTSKEECPLLTEQQVLIPISMVKNPEQYVKEKLGLASGPKTIFDLIYMFKEEFAVNMRAFQKRVEQEPINKLIAERVTLAAHLSCARSWPSPVCAIMAQTILEDDGAAVEGFFSSLCQKSKRDRTLLERDVVENLRKSGLPDEEVAPTVTRDIFIISMLKLGFHLEKPHEADPPSQGPSVNKSAKSEDAKQEAVAAKRRGAAESRTNQLDGRGPEIKNQAEKKAKEAAVDRSSEGKGGVAPSTGKKAKKKKKVDYQKQLKAMSEVVSDYKDALVRLLYLCAVVRKGSSKPVPSMEENGSARGLIAIFDADIEQFRAKAQSLTLQPNMQDEYRLLLEAVNFFVFLANARYPQLRLLPPHLGHYCRSVQRYGETIEGLKVEDLDQLLKCTVNK
jgi:hypothetical protein